MGTYYSICCNEEKYNDNNINYQINITQNIHEIILKQNNNDLNEKNIVDFVKISARTKNQNEKHFEEKLKENKFFKLAEENETLSVTPGVPNQSFFMNETVNNIQSAELVSEKLKQRFSFNINFNDFKVEEKFFDYKKKINFFSCESLQKFFFKQTEFIKDNDILTFIDEFSKKSNDYDNEIKNNIFNFFDDNMEVKFINNFKLNFCLNENNFLSTTANNIHKHNNNICNKSNEENKSDFTYEINHENLNLIKNKNLSGLLKTGYFTIDNFSTPQNNFLLSKKNNNDNNNNNNKTKKTYNPKNKFNLFPIYPDLLKKDKIYFGGWSLNLEKLNNLLLFNKSNNKTNTNILQIKNLNALFDFDGPGILLKKNAIFEGLFKNDLLNGPGRITTHIGDVFKGIFENGILNKAGIFENSSGNKYEGEFKLNKMHGKGKEVFKDGSVFFGSYVNNQKNGKGKFIWADGSQYEGDIVCNKIDGFGSFIWVNGLKYSGEWKKGKMHGKGFLDFNNGEFYEGFFYENKKQGKGKYFWSLAKFYEGIWIDNLQNGEGVFVNGDKEVKGFWKDGKMIKKI